MLKIVKIEQHLEIILREMCNRVNVKFEDVDFTQEDWADTHTWTIPQEIQFQAWLYDYFVINKDCVLAMSDFRSAQTISTRELEQLVKEFTLFYGWGIEEDIDAHLENLVENKPKKK
jgi:hypothetical protein